MADEPIPVSLAGKPTATSAERSAKYADSMSGTLQRRHPYSELFCNTCHSILLTFQRLGTQAEEETQEAGCSGALPALPRA